MRALLCGGGTAGHVMPAIAIAEIIDTSFKNSVIAFAGRRDGAENKAYASTGHKLYTLDIQGISRSFSLNNIKSIIKVLKSGRISKRIIKEFEPDIIIGTGGYVCYPFIRQGIRLGIKTVMHESNIFPGLVTRILGKGCDKLLLNYEETKSYLKSTKNTVVVGNPIRRSFSLMSKEEARRRLGIRQDEIFIVSFGGSLGAEVMNEAIIDFINNYTISKKRIKHVHVAGRTHYDVLKKKHPDLFKKHTTVEIVPYIEDMPLYLSAADIAITRSGAMTISELCHSATPSILIPSPNVTSNHQYKNAKHLEKAGAAIVIEENDLNGKILYDTVSKLIDDSELMRKMSQRARSSYQKNTNTIIADIIGNLLSTN